MRVSRILPLAIVLFCLGLAPVKAQVLTEAEAAAWTQRVETGWKSVLTGDTAALVLKKMGKKSGNIHPATPQSDEKWLYFTAHMTYTVVFRDGKVLSKESKLD